MSEEGGDMKKILRYLKIEMNRKSLRLARRLKTVNTQDNTWLVTE